MTINRIWNRWVQNDNTERHAGSQRHLITGSRECRHVIHMALMDHSATSQEYLQWNNQRRTRPLKWSKSCLEHQYDRIQVWQYRDECTLAGCIHHRHTGPSSGVMVRDAIGYSTGPPLVRTDGTSNSTPTFLKMWGTPPSLGEVALLRRDSEHIEKGSMTTRKRPRKAKKQFGDNRDACGFDNSSSH
ncbi:uncharacterized protein TNCV_1757741 [Trichonephila clavipes]|nr:uncharacterized protein TNCV_1757741 [Trichonephila clavipes]